MTVMTNVSELKGLRLWNLNQQPLQQKKQQKL